jgi:protein arginine kinase activator
MGNCTLREMEKVLCEECKKRKAIINFTQIIDNKVTTFHLCENCAGKKGVSSQSNISDSPLNIFFSQSGSQAKEEKAEVEGKSCDSCGSTYREFQESRRLGCPQCYFTFEQELGSLLRRIQGSQVHVGKGPREKGTKLSTRESRLKELKKLLEESVQKEEYERAAMLRDEIRGLEGKEASEIGEGGEESEFLPDS